MEDLTSSPIHTNELPWMPLSPGISARPLWFGGDARALQLKVEPGATVDLHRHTGAVHAYNISGSRRLGTGEIAGPGAYVYEPAGNVDCWSCFGEEPCIVQITLSGEFIEMGEEGEEKSATDTDAFRTAYLNWCRRTGTPVLALGAA